MPSHKSCEKRMRTAAAARLRNRSFRSQLREALKALRTETNKEAALKKFREAAAFLDKAAQRGLIHRRNADRNKSRLARHVGRLA